MAVPYASKTELGSMVSLYVKHGKIPSTWKSSPRIIRNDKDELLTLFALLSQGALSGHILLLDVATERYTL